MSDDQSFYEIQLNTPHLVLAFLGAAVVGVAFFYLGVVIGRGQAEAGPGGATAAADWQQAEPGASTPVGEDDDDPVDLQQELSQPVTPPASDTSTAANDDPVAEEPASVDPAPEFQPADPVEEEPVRVEAESNSGLPMPDSSLASGWIIQVRSTPDENSANSLQAALVVAGFPAFVVSADVNGQTYYRVRVGRYGSRTDADIVEAELQTRSDVDATWVTEG